MKANGQRAFSLIEVMLAVALFAVAVTVLSQSFLNGLVPLALFKKQRSVEQDVRFVRRQVLSIKDRKELEEGGEIETATSGLAQWEAEIEQAGVIDLHKVTLTIRFAETEGHKAQTVSHTHYLLRPLWSEPDERSELLQERRKFVQERRRRAQP